MPIKNLRNKKILANRIRFCKNFLNKAVGLILHTKLKDKGLIFVYKKEKKVALHMVFVFFPIDVLYLDKNKKVIDMKKNFRPFSFYTPSNKAQYVLELPNGITEKTKTRIGDKISF